MMNVLSWSALIYIGVLLYMYHACTHTCCSLLCCALSKQFIMICCNVWGISSNGRAPALHAGGTGIDTQVLQKKFFFLYFVHCRDFCCAVNFYASSFSWSSRNWLLLTTSKWWIHFIEAIQVHYMTERTGSIIIWYSLLTITCVFNKSASKHAKQVKETTPDLVYEIDTCIFLTLIWLYLYFWIYKLITEHGLHEVCGMPFSLCWLVVVISL